MLEVIKKLRFKNKAIVLNAPKEFEKVFIEMGYQSTFDKKIKSSETLIFVTNQKELLNSLKKDLKHIEVDSILWYSYPKGSSKIKTDINRDSIHAITPEFGLKTVSAIAINEIWSAMRLRPIELVGT